MSKLIGRSGVRTRTVQPTLLTTLITFVIPVTVVTQVEVGSYVCVPQTGVHDFVFTPVESRTPIAGLLIGNTVVDFLHKSLEVGEVLEGFLSSHGRVGLLVQIVRTGCHP
jgi:hypothetical protein